MTKEAILSGGYDKYDLDPESKFGVYRGIIYRYQDEVAERMEKGEKVGIITLAKDDGAYKQHLDKLPERVDIIGYTTVQTNWENFDLLLILGGDSLRLKLALEALGFSLENLKEKVKVVGDSAGAHILSAWFYYEHEDNPGVYTFYPGFNPDSNIIALVHDNNPRYVNPQLRATVDEFASKKGLTIVGLRENQEFSVGSNNVI